MMEHSSREKHSKSILEITVEWNDELEDELDELDRKYWSEYSDIEHDCIDEDGVLH